MSKYSIFSIFLLIILQYIYADSFLAREKKQWDLDVSLVKKWFAARVSLTHKEKGQLRSALIRLGSKTVAGIVLSAVPLYAAKKIVFDKKTSQVTHNNTLNVKDMYEKKQQNLAQVQAIVNNANSFAQLTSLDLNNLIGSLAEQSEARIADLFANKSWTQEQVQGLTKDSLQALFYADLRAGGDNIIKSLYSLLNPDQVNYLNTLRGALPQDPESVTVPLQDDAVRLSETLNMIADKSMSFDDFKEHITKHTQQAAMLLSNDTYFQKLSGQKLDFLIQFNPSELLPLITSSKIDRFDKNEIMKITDDTLLNIASYCRDSILLKIELNRRGLAMITIDPANIADTIFFIPEKKDSKGDDNKVFSSDSMIDFLLE